MRHTLSPEAPELDTEVVNKAYQEFPKSEIVELRNALGLSHISLIELRYFAEGQAKKRADEQIKRNEQLLGL